MIDDELVGWIGREVVYTAPEPLGRAAIRYFARAVGDDDPIYTDDGAARAVGHAGVVAPPTLVCETEQFLDLPRRADGYAGHVWELPLGPCTLVRGGNAYRFFRRVRPEDVVTVRWRLADLARTHSAKLGAMVVVTSHVRYTAQDGELLALNVDTTLYVPRSERA